MIAQQDVRGIVKTHDLPVIAGHGIATGTGQHDIAAKARSDRVGIAQIGIHCLNPVKRDRTTLSVSRCGIHTCDVTKDDVVAAGIGQIIRAKAQQDQIATRACGDGIVTADGVGVGFNQRQIGCCCPIRRCLQDAAVVADDDIITIHRPTCGRIDHITTETADHDGGTHPQINGVVATDICR